jgi:hypothetical protein|tara:strand:- start:319 stop:660 length:342 start_codon:yes stop_codon:yes gene_type:complete
MVIMDLEEITQYLVQLLPLVEVVVDQQVVVATLKDQVVLVVDVVVMNLVVLIQEILRHLHLHKVMLVERGLMTTTLVEAVELVLLVKTVHPLEEVMVVLVSKLLLLDHQLLHQ